jgi:hypothetical protein
MLVVVGKSLKMYHRGHLRVGELPGVHCEAHKR